MNDIVIVGTGGFAKETAFVIEEINKKEYFWNLLGFIASDKQLIGSTQGKYKVYNTDDWLLTTDKKVNIVFGLGDPKLISKLSNKFKMNNNLIFPNLIHPNAIGDWEKIILGKGNIICAGNIFTTDIFVGSFNVFNLSCTVGHDTEIGNCNVFNPTVNISGGVKIENNILIGTGSQLLQYMKICSDSTIGAGSLVTKNIEVPGVYVGTPARKIK